MRATLALIGKALGVAVEPHGYHQPPEVVTTMVATTVIPWGER